MVLTIYNRAEVAMGHGLDGSYSNEEGGIPGAFLI